MKWEYDEERRVYLDAKTGRELSIEELEAIVASIIFFTRRKLRKLARMLEATEITTATFFREAGEVIKQSHLLAGAIGRGGKAQMTARTWGIAGAQIKKQYRYLAKFERLVTSGKLVAIQILKRISKYAASVQKAFYVQYTDEQKGKTRRYARRFLHASESCVDCIRYASWGWHPIEQLIAPTEKCICGQFCKCSVKLADTPPKGDPVKN